MKDDKRKEIEAKWLQLIAENEKPDVSQSPAKNIFAGAKVIRRRKGKTDLHIS